MTVEFTRRFIRAYEQLRPEEQEAILQAVDWVQSNRDHPSLLTNKIQGRTGIWEARASRDLRLTCQFGPDHIVFRVCGHHDEVLRRP
jgi:mRNA-degrading endonuclease RelE of RelBE toxin-antitoxin system